MFICHSRGTGMYWAGESQPVTCFEGCVDECTTVTHGGRSRRRWTVWRDKAVPVALGHYPTQELGVDISYVEED